MSLDCDSHFTHSPVSIPPYFLSGNKNEDPLCYILEEESAWEGAGQKVGRQRFPSSDDLVVIIIKRREFGE